MKVFLVGGALRDALLGKKVHDLDWMVVGASVEKMLQENFTPVGKDFPVFLHPQTKEEYALARTERKFGSGYKGFVVHSSPNVTLEEDLSRRDLTINSIALSQSLSTSELLSNTSLLWQCKDLIDPHGGLSDLKHKQLRHITYAFTEDPVRILRVARFAAQFPDFQVAPETVALMCEMVVSGEVDALVPERVWQEIAKGLGQSKPSRMFEVLRQCGALKKLLPEVDALWGLPQRTDYHPEIDVGIHTMMALDYAAASKNDLEVCLAVLCHDLGKATTPSETLPKHLGHEERGPQLVRQLSTRLRIPKILTSTAEIVAREHGNIHASNQLGSAALLRLLHRCDALRKPERFKKILQACACDARGKLHFENCNIDHLNRLEQALRLSLEIPAQQLAQEATQKGLTNQAIGDYLDEARSIFLKEKLKLSS